MIDFVIKMSPNGIAAYKCGRADGIFGFLLIFYFWFRYSVMTINNFFSIIYKLVYLLINLLY